MTTRPRTTPPQQRPQQRPTPSQQQRPPQQAQRTAPQQARPVQRPQQQQRIARPSAGRSLRELFGWQPQTLENHRAVMADNQRSIFDKPLQDEFRLWRPKEGTTYVRFCPPSWEGARNHYSYTVWMHTWVGPNNANYLCPNRMLGRRCPICEAMQDAQRDNDNDTAYSLSPKRQHAAWLIDRSDDNPYPPAVYFLPRRSEEMLAGQLTDERTQAVIQITDPDEGYDVKIVRTGRGTTTQYALSVDRHPTPLHADWEVAEQIAAFVHEHPIPDVLKFYDESYLEQVIFGTLEQADPLDETSQDFSHEEAEASGAAYAADDVADEAVEEEWEVTGDGGEDTGEVADDVDDAGDWTEEPVQQTPPPATRQRAAQRAAAVAAPPPQPRQRPAQRGNGRPLPPDDEAPAPAPATRQRLNPAPAAERGGRAQTRPARR